MLYEGPLIHVIQNPHYDHYRQVDEIQNPDHDHYHQAGYDNVNLCGA